MKVKDLFHIGDLVGSFNGTDTFLDRNNCQIFNKSKKDDAVILHLRRVSDGGEAQSYLRVRKEFSEISEELLHWAFRSTQIGDLTLNQLAELETNLQIHSLNGKISLNRK